MRPAGAINASANDMAAYLQFYLNRGVASDLIEPGGEHRVRCEAMRVVGKIDESGLGDLFGKLRRADLAQRGPIDQVEVSPDEFGEGVLGVLLGIAREKFQVGIAHLQQYNVAGGGNPTNIFI
jgi:CubicO group peptidase (beta-lactamase class C family)